MPVRSPGPGAGTAAPPRAATRAGGSGGVIGAEAVWIGAGPRFWTGATTGASARAGVRDGTTAGDEVAVRSSAVGTSVRAGVGAEAVPGAGD